MQVVPVLEPAFPVQSPAWQMKKPAQNPHCTLLYFDSDSENGDYDQL